MNKLIFILDRLFVVLGAFLGSQIPTFMQQYIQKLSGHVDELTHLIALMKKNASHNHKNLDSYIHKFLTNTDADISMQGQFMHSILQRWQDLSDALNSYLSSNVWLKPFIFIEKIDREIFSSTAASYHPALTLTFEGVIYTLVGILFGTLLFQLIQKSIRNFLKRGYVDSGVQSH